MENNIFAELRKKTFGQLNDGLLILFSIILEAKFHSTKIEV